MARSFHQSQSSILDGAVWDPLPLNQRKSESDHTNIMNGFLRFTTVSAVGAMNGFSSPVHQRDPVAREYPGYIQHSPIQKSPCKTTRCSLMSFNRVVEADRSKNFLVL